MLLRPRLLAALGATALTASATLTLIASPAAAIPPPAVVVREVDGTSWSILDPTVCGGDAGATHEFEEGPGTPPLGTGSLGLSVGADGNSYVRVSTSLYNGTPLEDLSALSYSTYVEQPGSSTQAPFLRLSIDLDDDGLADDSLAFEPTYQDGTYVDGDIVPDQGDVTVGTWQSWDALTGGWSSPPLITLASYISANPGAKLSTEPAGSLRVQAGCGAPDWDDFVGNADRLVVGVNGTDTTYDFEAPPPILVADDDGMGTAADCDATDPAHSMVQDAVDDAVDGDTVTVCPGTYAEQVVIDDDITVDGSGEAASTIAAPASTLVASENDSFATAIVEVQDGADVSVNDLTVAGPGPDACDSVRYGIWVVDDSDLELDRVTVSDIRDEPLSSCEKGLAVAAGEAFLGQTGSLDADDVTVSGYQKSGFYVSGNGSSATIANSTVTGAGPIDETNQQGVQVNEGATATISDSTISDNDYSLGTSAAGVLLLNSGPVTLEGNTFTGNDVALWDLGASASTVTGNTVDANDFGLLLFTDGAIATENTITNNVGAGILVSDGAVEATFNRIVGNGSGIEEIGTGSVVATANWWGCNTGPNTVGCDSTTGAVSSDPWLVLRVTRSVGTTYSTSTITADLTRDRFGLDRSAEGTVPDGTPVTFATTLGSVDPTAATTVDGKATTTLSTDGDVGTATVTATVDGEARSTTVTLKAARPSISNGSRPEGNSSVNQMVFDVTLDRASDVPISVSYATVAGSAKTPSDFVTETGTVTFAPGETVKQIDVGIVGDTTAEPNETFTVKLSSSSNGLLGDASGTGTITNDDAVPTASINDRSGVEGTSLVFTITLDKAAAGSVKVKYATADGTAVQPGDYAAKTGSVTFQPGQTSKTVTVVIKRDSMVEAAQSFAVNLTSGTPAGVAISDSQGVGTINANNT